MSKRIHYTSGQMARFYLQDLVVDIRCARRDGLSEYAEKCAQEFRSLWSGRHAATIDKHGAPERKRYCDCLHIHDESCYKEPTK
jgi:hypothetical protein